MTSWETSPGKAPAERCLDSWNVRVERNQRIFHFMTRKRVLESRGSLPKATGWPALPFLGRGLFSIHTHFLYELGAWPGRFISDGSQALLTPLCLPHLPRELAARTRDARGWRQPPLALRAWGGSCPVLGVGVTSLYPYLPVPSSWLLVWEPLPSEPCPADAGILLPFAFAPFLLTIPPFQSRATSQPSRLNSGHLLCDLFPHPFRQLVTPPHVPKTGVLLKHLQPHVVMICSPDSLTYSTVTSQREGNGC